MDPAGRESTREPDLFSAQMGPLLTLLCQKGFCLLLHLGHIPKYPLCFLSSVWARPQEGVGEGKNPMLVQTCLGNIITENRLSTLEELQKFLTLKEYIHHFLYGVTGLIRDFVL